MVTSRFPTPLPDNTLLDPNTNGLLLSSADVAIDRWGDGYTLAVRSSVSDLMHSAYVPTPDAVWAHIMYLLD